MIYFFSEEVGICIITTNYENEMQEFLTEKRMVIENKFKDLKILQSLMHSLQSIPYSLGTTSS